jgi:hypothetical protein
MYLGAMYLGARYLGTNRSIVEIKEFIIKPRVEVVHNKEVNSITG